MAEVHKIKQPCYRVAVMDNGHLCEDSPTNGDIKLHLNSRPVFRFTSLVVLRSAAEVREVISILQDYLIARHDADLAEAAHG